MSATPGLLAAAAGVGFGHAVLPDHWVPLAVVGRTQRYPLARVARLSGLAAVAHVLVSLVLGALIVVIGLQFRSIVEHAQNVIVGCLLIGTGVGFVVYELVGPAHRHSHRHDHVHGPTGAAAIIVPFGAAASPDLTILPVFLAASTAGVAPAVGSLIVFAAVTITTIVGLTLFATLGGHQIRAGWLDRWGNLFTAAVLSAIGILILTGTL